MLLIFLTRNSDQAHQRTKCQNNTQQQKNTVDAVWNDVGTEHDKPCTHTLKGVHRHTQKRILVMPGQTRRLDDDLETTCVTRNGADATPSNSKEKDRGFSSVKMNKPNLPETTPCYYVKAERWITGAGSTASEQVNYTTVTKHARPQV